VNALDRAAGEIIARYLHEQDPRWVWDVLPAPTSEPGERERDPRRLSAAGEAGANTGDEGGR
jgi:hypothetical protein